MENSNEIWNEIIEITKERYTPKQPNEMSMKDFIEETKIKTGDELPRKTAYDFLQSMVKEKKLKVRKYKGENLYSPL